MSQARLLRHVGKGPVAVVPKQIACRLEIADLGIEAAAVDEEDIEPAVVVVIEERDATAHFLEQELLVGPIPRDVEGSAEASRCCHVLELDQASTAVLRDNQTGRTKTRLGRGDERGSEKLEEAATRLDARRHAIFAPAQEACSSRRDASSPVRPTPARGACTPRARYGSLRSGPIADTPRPVRSSRKRP